MQNNMCLNLILLLVTVAPVATTVVVTAGTGMLGNGPTNIQCPHCHAHVVTRLDYEVGTLTWLIAGVLCLVG